MSKYKLSNIENNLAVIIALTEAQADTMESLTEQYEKLMEVSSNFEAARDVWEESAVNTRNAIQLQMAGLDVFDKQGKVKEFLESHKLEVKWVKK